MPTGISQSVVNPAALTPRSDPEAIQSDRRQAGAASTAGSREARSVAAGDPAGQLVRAPEPEAGAQGVENQTPATAGATGAEGRELPGTPVQAQSNDATDQTGTSDGLGGILDVTA